MEEVEMKQLGSSEVDDDKLEDETYFGGPQDDIDELEWNRTPFDELAFGGLEVDGPTVTISDARTKRIRRRLTHRDCEDFFTDILDLEPQCSEPEFVDHLINSEVLSIGRMFNKYSRTTDYRVKYLGGEFETTLRTLGGHETELLRDALGSTMTSGLREDWITR